MIGKRYELAKNIGKEEDNGNISSRNNIERCEVKKK